MTLPWWKYGKPLLEKILAAWRKATIKWGKKVLTLFFVMTHDEILLIPADQTITYARVVVDFFPQKLDPHQIQIMAGGNLINYPGELTTRTVDLTTSKLMWNSVLSTKGANYMCLDIKNLDCPPRSVWIHKNAALPLPILDKSTVQPGQARKKRVCIPWNAPRRMGPSPGWHLGKQITTQMTPPPWILRV
jgi:hypothetical protein